MFTLLTSLALTAHAADPAPAPPTVPEASVVRPTFAVGDKKYTAGTAFFTKIGTQTVLISSHGLLGPGGGLPAQLPPADVANVTVTLVDAWTRRETAKAGPGKVVADAGTVADGANRDLAVFAVSLGGFDTVATNTYAPPVPLVVSATAPKVGDTVWLAAPVIGSTARVHAARVGDVSEQAIYVDFADKLDLTGTSGAPFLDAKGEVVGMCVGGGVMEGVVVGAANPSASIAARATKALGAK